MITEEMLQLIEDQEDDKDFPFNNYGLKETLSKYLVEIDQLTVSKLRPMSECQSGWLIKLTDSDQFHMCTALGSHGSIFTSDAGIHSVLRDNYKGCIPPIIYKPEQP